LNFDAYIWLFYTKHFQCILILLNFDAYIWLFYTKHFQCIVTFYNIIEFKGRNRVAKHTVCWQCQFYTCVLTCLRAS